MRLTGSRLTEFKERAQQLRDKGLSYPAIGRILGKHHTTVLQHLNAEYRAKKKQQMAFRYYLNHILPREEDMADAESTVPR